MDHLSEEISLGEVSGAFGATMLAGDAGEDEAGRRA
jgi:hypothetical protein